MEGSFDGEYVVEGSALLEGVVVLVSVVECESDAVPVCSGDREPNVTEGDSVKDASSLADLEKLVVCESDDVMESSSVDDRETVGVGVSESLIEGGSLLIVTEDDGERESEYDTVIDDDVLSVYVKVGLLERVNSFVGESVNELSSDVLVSDGLDSGDGDFVRDGDRSLVPLRDSVRDVESDGGDADTSLVRESE